MKENKLYNLVLWLVVFLLVIIITKYLNIIILFKKFFIILMPLFIGFIYAWFFNPFILNLSKKYNRKLISILLFLFIIFSSFSLIYFIVPIIYKEVSDVINVLPNIFNVIHNRLDSLGCAKYLNQLLEFIMEFGPKYVVSFVSNLFKYLGVLGIGLVLGLYISIDYLKVIEVLETMVPKKYECFIVNIMKEVSESSRKCIHGTLLVAFVVGFLDTILFFLIKLDAPLIFGFICGLTDLIPYIGPYIGGIIAVLVGFSKSTMIGIEALAVCILVQMVENYCLQPLIMSKSVKISPILIIVGLLILGNFFGVIGMIVATPVVASIKIFIEHIDETLKKCRKD